MILDLIFFFFNMDYFSRFLTSSSFLTSSFTPEQSIFCCHIINWKCKSPKPPSSLKLSVLSITYIMAMIWALLTFLIYLMLLHMYPPLQSFIHMSIFSSRPSFPLRSTSSPLFPQRNDWSKFDEHTALLQ